MGQTMSSIFPKPYAYEDDHNSGLGPRGIGDPDDMTLRDKEMLVYIPKYQKKAAEHNCKRLLRDYEDCTNRHIVHLFYCRSQFNEHIECLDHWSFDEKYREQITQEYLNVRQEYRKTGRRRLYRALKGETYVTESQLKGFQV